MYQAQQQEGMGQHTLPIKHWLIFSLRDTSLYERLPLMGLEMILDFALPALQANSKGLFFESSISF
jgi:hypothetical protein